MQGTELRRGDKKAALILPKDGVTTPSVIINYVVRNRFFINELLVLLIQASSAKRFPCLRSRNRYATSSRAAGTALRKRRHSRTPCKIEIEMSLKSGHSE